MLRLSFLMVFLTLATVLQAKEYPVRWKALQTSVDGDISDWKRNLSYFDASTRMRYDIRNDSNNLYIAMSISDQMMKTKASAAGIELKFKYKNDQKLKPVVFIKPFLKRGMRRGAGRSGQMGQRGQQEQKMEIEQRRATYKLNKPPVELSGFTSCNGNIYSMQHDKSIRYAFDLDSTGTMIMELMIPLAELHGKDKSFEEILKQSIALSISLKAMERPDGQGGGGGGMGPGGRPGGGHPGGGGMRPGMQGAAQQDMMKMFETQFFRKKFLLATKPE